MRTGIRCTTFVKLPVALSGGSSENFAPVAGDRLSTWPRKCTTLYASTVMSAESPGVTSAVSVSLRFAVTHTSSSGTTVISGWPACTNWPSSTAFLATTPADDVAAHLREHRHDVAVYLRVVGRDMRAPEPPFAASEDQEPNQDDPHDHENPPA